MGFDSKAIVTFSIAMLIMAAIVPVAISSVINANQTGWSSSTKSMWGIIPIVVIGGIVIGAAVFFISKRR